ncbi:MAG: CxxxxCH/CxxCH domain-containing protein [Geobacter sp.]|nr:CxxxxCH/CxxCH domain-containing protein [Geobacter sp.]
MKKILTIALYSGMMFGLTGLTLTSNTAQAASVLNSCTTYCHGMPPKDAARKGNPHFGSQSSAFIGNHANHLPATPTAASCTVCHTPVAATNYGHQDNVINMANSLKGYSSATLRARYDKGVFFNQTSVPNLTAARCSNTSCHFEKQTPLWGSAAYVTPADCSACHGAPPSGTTAAPAGGVAGSHARHEAYFPGTTNCQKCHANHTTFTHATSAGRALKVQGFMRDPLNTVEASATYSGAGTNYLPSKSGTQTFGTCANLYCHSSGQSATGSGAGTAVTTPAWGGAALNCGSCHQNMGPAVNAAATGKHAKHAQTAGISCSACHGVGYTSTTAPAGTTHVNKMIELGWTGLAATPVTAYTKTNSFAAGSAVYGSCSNSYCHSTVQNATTGANSAVTYRSVSWASATTLTCAGCHVDMATDAVGTGSHRIHTLATGANFDCAKCHLNYTKTTTAAATHVNGTIELGAAGFTYSQGSGAANPAGNGYGSCSASACHGSAVVPWGGTLWSTTDQCGKCHSSAVTGAVTAATPFYGTSFPTKVTANTDPKVGAHTSHLTSTDSLSGSLACADCHGSVAISSVTHMTGSTAFAWSTLAKTGGLTPAYNSTTGVCSNVYCHGAAMPGGDTSGTNKSPTWNVAFLPATLSSAACGTCHGFPPSTASGHPAVSIPAGFPATASIGTTCSCHSNINPAGNSYANIFINKALHINGIAEVIAGGSCDACHGYPPASVAFAGTQGNWSSAKAENYLGGGGAHTINNHVSKLAKPGDGFANCVMCHDAADHQMSPINFIPSQNIKVKVSQRFRVEAAKQFKYSSNRLDGGSHQTGTCSNNSCHYGATPKWDPIH